MSTRRTQAPPKHSAANSHIENDKYMEDWDKAYEAMRKLTMDPDSPYSQFTPINAAGSGRPAPRPAGALPSSVSSSSRPGGSSKAVHRPAASGSTRSSGVAAAGPGAGASRWPSAVTASWHTGPMDPEGILCDVSDRPVLCSSAHWGRGEVVFGCSDHALYIIDPVKGTRKRTLYSKTCGHSEWVTCCTYLPSGQVVSDGMDSRMWLWPAGGVRGVEAQGHGGPLSQLAYDASSGCVVSSSYDKTVRLWDVSGAGLTDVVCLEGHPGPVLEMEVNTQGAIVSGDRSGHVILWDTQECCESWHMKRVHTGHITSLAWWGQDEAQGAGGDNLQGCFVSGGQDGMIRVWDPRSRTNLSKQELHVNAQGRGAVSDLAAGGRAASGLLVSAGADGTVCICDPRMSFAIAHQIQLKDFPYSLAVAGGLALVGCGDGSLWVIHVNSGQVRYCLGANKHAVRCVEACEDKLLAAGDDGNVITWAFA